MRPEEEHCVEPLQLVGKDPTRLPQRPDERSDRANALVMGQPDNSHASARQLIRRSSRLRIETPEQNDLIDTGRKLRDEVDECAVGEEDLTFATKDIVRVNPQPHKAECRWKDD